MRTQPGWPTVPCQIALPFGGMHSTTHLSVNWDLPAPPSLRLPCPGAWSCFTPFLALTLDMFVPLLTRVRPVMARDGPYSEDDWCG